MSLHALPIHPHTGLPALALGKRGPIWPVLGGAEEGTDGNGEKDTTGSAGDTDTGFPAGTPVADMTAEQQVAYWKDKARKHEERNRGYSDYDALKQKASEFDKLTEAQKSDLEKAQAEAEKFRTEAQQLQGQMLRTTVAATKGLPADMAARLVGNTQQELEADADNLLALIKPVTKPDQDQGSRGKGSTKVSESSGRDLYKQRHPAKTTT